MEEVYHPVMKKLWRKCMILTENPNLSLKMLAKLISYLGQLRKNI